MHSARLDHTEFAERSSETISERPWALNFRVLLRLGVRVLTECFTTLQARYSPDLPPLRGQPTQPLGISPPPMRSNATSPWRQAALLMRHHALRGINPTEPGTNSMSSSNPHEVFHHTARPYC
jgi:hypothetical protein